MIRRIVAAFVCVSAFCPAHSIAAAPNTVQTTPLFLDGFIPQITTQALFLDGFIPRITTQALLLDGFIPTITTPGLKIDGTGKSTH